VAFIIGFGGNSSESLGCMSVAFGDKLERLRGGYPAARSAVASIRKVEREDRAHGPGLPGCCRNEVAANEWEMI
jgi:hypothetical protein